MSDAMQSVIEYLETGVGDLWSMLYDLSRDELIQLFKELDYAIYLKCVREEQHKVYAMTTASLRETYREDE